jgi:hypothetical protein
MTSVWSDKQKGNGVTDRPASVEVLLLSQMFVFPWNQFLNAHGNDEEIRVSFSTHDVVVRGIQVRSLLEDVSAQRLVRLRESGRADAFRSNSAPQIISIEVQKVG